MKKGLLFILMVGASVCLSAQEKGKTEGKAYTVETNRFVYKSLALGAAPLA